MSVSIAVSAQSIELLRAHVAPGKQLATGIRLPDGRWAIEVDEEVLAHLNAIHLDPDQAIRILCSTWVGHA